MNPTHNAKEYYNRTSREYTEKWSALNQQFSQSHFYRRKIMEAVLKAADLQKTDKVIEVGCGTGLVLRELLKKVRPVFGADISVEMLNRVRDSVLSDKKVLIVGKSSELSEKADSADVVLMENNFLSLDLPTDYFDKILSVEVLRYVQDLDKAFANIAAIMKKDSLLVFTITNFWSASLFPIKYSLRKLLGSINPEKELLQYFVTKRSLARKLKNAGLTIQKFERLGFLSVHPLSKKLIKNELTAKKFDRLDRFWAKIPIVRSFFDTFLVTVKKI